MIPYFLSKDSYIKMDQYQAEWLETTFMIGGVIGIPFTVLFTQKIDAKNGLIFSVFVVIVCWATIGLTNSLGFIYAARFLLGLGYSTAYTAAPIYVAEISDKNIRGFLSSNIFILEFFGFLLMYIIGAYMPYYTAPAVALFFLTVEVIIFIFMPQSPYYFAAKNQPEKARKCLEKFRGTKYNELELQEIIKSVTSENKHQAKFKDIILVKNYRKAFLIAAVLNGAHSFSGLDVMLMNLHEILSSSKSLYMNPSNVAIIFSFINFLSALISSISMDKFGRKKLLIVSSFLSGLCITALALYYNLEQIGYDTAAVSWVPVYSFFILAAVYKFGLGLVPIVVIAEIFATKIKTIGITLANGILMMGTTISLQVFFRGTEFMGMQLPFYVYSCCCFLLCVFAQWYLPETKGKSLDEIQDILMK